MQAWLRIPVAGLVVTGGLPLVVRPVLDGKAGEVVTSKPIPVMVIGRP